MNKYIANIFLNKKLIFLTKDIRNLSFLVKHYYTIKTDIVMYYLQYRL